MKSRKFPVVGITVVTPAMTAGEGASAKLTQPSAIGESAPAPDAAARLKAEMLGIGLGEKLEIAGDRVQLQRLAAAAGGGQAGPGGGTTKNVANTVACATVNCGNVNGRGTVQAGGNNTGPTCNCAVNGNPGVQAGGNNTGPTCNCAVNGNPGVRAGGNNTGPTCNCAVNGNPGIRAGGNNTGPTCNCGVQGAGQPTVNNPTVNGR